ncbi:MAG: SDR family oxidoreductase [Alphaproteobacteria bacterium]|nr:SDR family oxidoreductase [Alphaproteobacteria bacterium]
MTKILIIGASRGIGLETAKAALDAGHEVRAFARGADKIPLDHPELEKFAGDALEAADIRRALAGVDVVIEVLGAPINPETILTGTRLFSDATRILVDAMEELGPKRLICVTGLGAGDSRDRLGGMFRLFFSLSLARIYDDKDVQERIVMNSKLDWTIARPGILRDGRATGLYRALPDPKDWKAGPIRRADVALFLVDEAERGTYRGKTPMIIA